MSGAAHVLKRSKDNHIWRRCIQRQHPRQAEPVHDRLDNHTTHLYKLPPQARTFRSKLTPNTTHQRVPACSTTSPHSTTPRSSPEERHLPYHARFGSSTHSLGPPPIGHGRDRVCPTHAVAALAQQTDIPPCRNARNNVATLASRSCARTNPTPIMRACVSLRTAGCFWRQSSHLRAPTT